MEPYFPHSVSTGPAPTAAEIYTRYSQAFEQQVSDGTLLPVIFPYHFLGLILLAIYLCIPHKKNPYIYAARWPLLAFISWFQIRLIWRTSGIGPGFGSVAGSILTNLTMASWNWLVFRKPQWDAKRLQRITQLQNVTDVKEVVSNSSKQKTQNKNLRQRNPLINLVKAPETKANEKDIQMDENQRYHYFWQPYPDNLRDRIPWITDLLCNFRGPGWNWAISPIPSLPPEVLMKSGIQVPERSYYNISPAGNRRFNTRSELFFYRTIRYICCYLMIDMLKIMMMKDPYFKFGPNTYALPHYLQSLPLPILRFYRTVVTSICVIIIMTMSLDQTAILLSCVLGPKILGLCGEAWYYPTEWGYFSSILQNGLGGLWGDCWHQTFRLSFTAPTNYLIRNGYLKPGSFIAKMTSLFIAFSLSGFLHWASSVSAFPPTCPSHMMIFFILQGVGIALQRLFSQTITSFVKLPKSIRYTGNLIFSILWLHYTGWLSADDFARGGLWLTELLPFSLSTYLGLGEHDAVQFNWRGYFKWHTGRKWWDSGIAII